LCLGLSAPDLYVHNLSLHDALPIFTEEGHDLLIVDRSLPDSVAQIRQFLPDPGERGEGLEEALYLGSVYELFARRFRVCLEVDLDRKSTRLNSSHVRIWYAVFCLSR